MIRAIIKRVGEAPHAIDIEPTLEGLRGPLGGDDVTLDRRACGNDFAIYFDDDGLAKQLPLNMVLGPWPLHGPVLFLGPAKNGAGGGIDTGLRPEVEQDLLRILSPPERRSRGVTFRTRTWKTPRVAEACRIAADGRIVDADIGYGEIFLVNEDGSPSQDVHIIIGEPLNAESSKRYVERLMADATVTLRKRRPDAPGAIRLRVIDRMSTTVAAPPKGEKL